MHKSQTKRVLIVGSYAPSLINFRGPLIARMAAAGHKVVAAAPGIDDQTAAKLSAIGAEPRSLQLSNASMSPMAALQSFLELRRLIRETQSEVLIAYTVKPITLGALAAHAEGVERIVVLVTGLGFAFTPGREFKRLVSRLAAWLLYRAALARSHIVLFQNPDDRALFEKLKLFSRSEASAIINGSGVDLTWFSPKEVPAEPSFLMIARLLGDKGIREFAQAATMLKAQFPTIRISLVGYLDPSPNSISQVELDEIVISGVEFLGRQQDVRAALEGCSVYVLPSYREGTPRSVLEAMAVGRAIITTDAPGCRETVRHGYNGFLVPPRDARALYETFLKFVLDPKLAITMGRASRQMAEERYDVQSVNAAIMAHAGLD